MSTGETTTIEPSARAWLDRLRQGECSARELVERCLRRIDEADPVLNAVVQRRDEEALAAADRADELRRSGRNLPLLGLPVTIKDSLDVRGWRTVCGSLARKDHRAQSDATVVARLRTAGAITIAKTNVPECCCSFETDNLIYGRTDNPLDPDRTPGGSSGGEAALLGADASIVGIGTDGGGSIRVPSHYCGLVGLRPTVGRTPETGAWPPTRAGGTMDLSCVGPLARHVEDLDLVLATIMGADGVDPYAVDQPLGDWRDLDTTSLRVGFYVDHPRVPAISLATRRAVRDAAVALRDAGAEICEIDPPDSGADTDGRSATELFFDTTGADGGAGLRRSVAGAGGRHHPQFLAILGDCDTPVPSVETFFATRRRCNAYRARVRSAFADLDLILSPVVAGPAPRHGIPPAGIPDADYLRYEAFEHCHVNALAGLPAGSVPVAEEDGLPIGVQLAAAPYREDLVLAGMATLERAFGGFAINRRLADRHGKAWREATVSFHEERQQ